METRICISTASYCLWDIEPSTKIAVSQELEFSRIEIGLSTIKMLRSFKSSSHLFQQLTPFKHITVNVPWCRVNYGNNNQTKVVIDCLKYLNEQLDIDAFVFRVDCISDFSLIGNSGLNIYLENSEKIGSWGRLQGILKSSEYQCVLDVNRATRNENYLRQIITEYPDRIAEVQLNGYKDGFYRVPITFSRQYNLVNERAMINEILTN
ncbi:hypothetical protein N752_06020 [Desulforamulus aquiferis]|nr:hypothetical protein [Desulforamulus aquiferis]RYD06083.1 hypothetical protein N752_06020 [Desulforamulus aquiferis]